MKGEEREEGGRERREGEGRRERREGGRDAQRQHLNTHTRAVDMTTIALC